jgi:hypothetical protein
MSTLANRLNFSDKNGSSSSIEVKKWSDVNHYDTLCKYCADNDIDLTTISDDDFYSCSEIMVNHGQHDKSTDAYFFWID